ncbi:hypothetical protein IGI04_002492, partial [Brassica rapa subsp. trilocularis]
SSRPPWYALVKVQIPVKKLPGKRRGDDAHREREEHSGGCDGNHFLAGAAERFQINLEQPGIGVGVWFGLFGHDQDLEMAYHDSISGRLRNDLGFRKGICGILRKVKIWIEGQWISIIITMDSSVNTGWIMVCDSFCSYFIRNDLYYQWLIWVLRCFEKVRLAEINLQGYGIAPDSKWVKVPERGNRGPSHHYGNHRGNGEGSRVKTTYREDVPVVGSGAQVMTSRTYPTQPREDQGQQAVPQVTCEEGEITRNGDAAAALPSVEFQMELSKTQAEGSEVVAEAWEEERGLLTVQGMREQQDDTFEDIEMELDAINAAMLESGIDLETEEEFQTLSEEELEQASEAQAENVLIQDEEQPVAGDAYINKELGTGELATRQSHGKRLFKANSSIAGSAKMRMASALLSPRKKGVAKVGTRHGDNTKPPENKGPSIPKPVNLKF